MRPRSPARGLLLAVGLAGGACGTESGPLDPPQAPSIDQVAMAPSAANVLSAVVTVSARQADSARVRFGSVESGALDSAAPSVRFEDGSAAIPVLGLLPATEYAVQVVAYGGGGTTAGNVLHFTTAALPGDLPSFIAHGSAPAEGYVVFAAGGYGLAIDNTGRVVWYVRLADAATLNFQPQPTGRYYTRPTTPVAPVPWQEIDPLGNVTRTLGCARGLIARFHDIIALADGSYWIMCDESRVIDLTAFGGQADARVTGTVVQHIGPDQQPLFEWSAFDHFSIEDLDPADRAGPTVNFTHGNAIDLDRNGNLLISFRSLSEITSVDTHRGFVQWRMGGRANQFTFTDMPPFRSQHGLRVGANGSLVLLDNLGDPASSRAERMQVDEIGYTVHLGGTAAPAPPTVAQLGGTTQPLPGGGLLVAFGNGNRVQEFDAGGAIVWEIQGNSGYVFRATRIRSLYNPGYGLTR
jgi:hypothetical protein